MINVIVCEELSNFVIKQFTSTVRLNNFWCEAGFCESTLKCLFEILSVFVQDGDGVTTVMDNEKRQITISSDSRIMFAEINEVPRDK